MKFIFAMTVNLGGIRVRFVYESHPLKGKVAGVKNA